MHAAAGRDFLHWRSHRPATVLFVDGEMARPQLRKRAVDAERRLGMRPPGFHLLSHEDIPDFQPLNTDAGRASIDNAITKIGKVDLIIFDNIMSLTIGDMKEEEGWRQVEPYTRELTKRCIGQLWIHHTGHNTDHGYGTKIKEWPMDAVALMTELKRTDADISFNLAFTKARHRTPENRRDFQDTAIALVNDQWISNATSAPKSKVSPLGEKFFAALIETLAGDNTTMVENWKVVSFQTWKDECVRSGILDPAKVNSARTLFNKHKNELIAANRIACRDDLVWVQ
jgi:AAA domain